ncbi:MAG: M1 family aminopeptidase [Candidatus Zixiibacteriota bacterium]
MKPVKIVLLSVAVFLGLIGRTFGQDYVQVLQLYDQMKNVALDETKVAQVDSLALKRDVGILRLNRGTICLFRPIQGRIIGAVFAGDGRLEFSPPTDIEKYQLRRFTKQEELNEPFSELCLLFTDTTAAELEHKLTFSPGDVPGGFKSIRKDGPSRFLKETGGSVWGRVLEDVLVDSSFVRDHPERGNGFFYADINTNNLGRLFFTFDPKQVEEVDLEEADSRPGMYARDMVCSFHREEDYLRNPTPRNTPIPGENKDEIKITHYRMEIAINIKEEISARVEMDFESQVDGIRVLNFGFDKDLIIEKITDEQGDSLPFIKDGDQFGVSVVLSRPTKSEEQRKLTFAYRGSQLIEQDWLGDLYIGSDTYWYPSLGYLPKATYDLIFKSPKGYKFVSMGKKTKEWIEGDSLCTEWVQDFPVSCASFNYGNFETYDKNLEGLPAVRIYHLEQTHAQTFTKGKKAKESVAADVVNSLNFFQTVFGKCPFPQIAVTEMPTSGGLGYPGILHLAWETFTEDEQIPETRFKAESYRAHEVSHQWWGHTVGWETYHDQWLSEGFAQYSGAWYAQLSMHDNYEFFEELKRWQKDILGKGSKWEEGSKVGPIWLGLRLNSSKSSDYGSLIYEKGAFVLHMLRNMMMDYDTKSDDRFQKMMGDFVETYRGKNATTEDFRAIVEKHVGQDMGWFFDEWIYGVEIPTYKFSYTTEKTPEGKYLVSCQVAQENVSKDFKMWVPVLLDFGSDQYAVVRVWIDKPQNTFQLPPAPLPPKQVTLNPFQAVLCEVKNK